MRQFNLGKSKEGVLNLVPEHTIKKVSLGNQSIGLLRIGETFFAFQSQCPHRGASLIQGSLNAAGELICPLHQYRFELKSGQVKAGSCPDLEVFPCELSESGLQITLPSK
ncbi:Rieske (2Fe-2S) protein [Algoriphagus marinus]|uniref:Rieske (2Fe-2S) protein n=1 Tax=Algoriphagus marinus TaxID=1925762 RepID=UPI00094B9B72|nr:Rieske (2Fe-2S) protein [Algoriphagus marinus]